MRRAAPVALTGLVVGLVTTLVVLADFGGDPSGFARFSEGSTRYAEPLVGEVVVSVGSGHDGKFFFALANDPWLTEPESHAFLLDVPTYRAQRMLYPMIAGGFGLASPSVVLWSLIGVNVLALAVGSGVVAAYAEDIGRSRWFGLAFACNPGLVFELMIDGGSVVAAVAAFAAILAFRRDRAHLATLLASLAVLGRETMVLVPLGLFLWSVLRRRETPWLLVFGSLAPYGLWMGYAGVRLSQLEPRFSAVDRNLDMPFAGLADVAADWFSTPRTAAFSLLILIVCAVVIRNAVVRIDLLAVANVGFALLPIVLSGAVLAEFFDVARVVAPAITAAFVLLAPERAYGREYVESPV